MTDSPWSRTAVIIAGHMRAGKTSAARYLAEKHGLVTYSLAGKLKELYVEVEGREDKDREWLQKIGQAHRRVFGDGFWAERLYEQLEKDGFPPLVIDDVRFGHELQFLLETLPDDLYDHIIPIFIDVSFDTMISRGAEIYLMGDESESLASILHNRIWCKDRRTTTSVFGMELAVLDGNQPLFQFYRSVSDFFDGYFENKGVV